MDVKSGEFFRNARRSGLWPDAEAIHHSTLSKARSKIDWQVFRNILDDAVCLAYECWPQSDQSLWHGRSVYAVDGSWYVLPATEKIREEFDPDSGLQLRNCGKGHYPQCMVSTVYDVFRRLPVARCVVGANSSEREVAKQLIPHVPAGSILLLDRGYPGYEFILHLLSRFNGHFILRCPAQNTFPAVEKFIKSGKQEDIIFIAPTLSCICKVSAERKKELKAIKLRVVRLKNPDGTLSVLLTNLYDAKEFTTHEISLLYFRRWEIENYFRDEKVVLEIERFHGKTSNSIRQELFAAMIMSVISRTLMVLSTEIFGGKPIEPQFKNAVMTLASEAAMLTASDPEKAVEVFETILAEIYRVKYYRPKLPRPSQLRVCKRAVNKWAVSKTRRVANA